MCLGIFFFPTVFPVYPSKRGQIENNNQKVTKQHPHLKVCFFLVRFLHCISHGIYCITGLFTCFLLYGHRSYCSRSSVKKFIEIGYPDMISFRHLISILHHFEEWIAEGIKQWLRTECDIRMDFDTNEYPNIFVLRKWYERISEYIRMKFVDTNEYPNILVLKFWYERISE